MSPGAAEERQRLAEEMFRRGRSDGTGDGVGDDWKASVEGQLKQLHGDVRNLLYGLIGGFLFLIAAGAIAFVNLAGQLADARKDIAASQVAQQRIAGDASTAAATLNGKLDALLERKREPNVEAGR